jgi:hypothetical protein
MKALSTIATSLLLSSLCLSFGGGGASADKNHNKKKNRHHHNNERQQITHHPVRQSQQQRPSQHIRGGRTSDYSDNEMSQDYLEEMSWLWDEDINDPPGPDEGWPHTEPFHLEETDMMASWQIIDNVVMNMMPKDDEDDEEEEVVNNNLPVIHMTQIARPEGSDTAYYTGATHFFHINNPNLMTLLFSAGRHDGGSNTFLTINTTASGSSDPFVGAQEQYIDSKDVSTFTWVSSFTYKEDTMDGLKIIHYALFSGGSGAGKIGPSKMYAFEENTYGQLKEPKLVWVEENLTRPARFCLLTDLGDIYDDDGLLVSKAGLPDIIITGLGGLDIYSKIRGDGDWKQVRSLPIVNEGSYSNPAGTSSYMGVAVVDEHRLLAISSRSRWKITKWKLTPESPCVLYDYVNDKVIETFSANAQTVSVDALHNGSQILLGSGGQAHYSPQPNLLFDMTKDDDVHTIILSDAQLVKDQPTLYGRTKIVDSTPTSPNDYLAVLESGLTKTRLVKSYSLFGGLDVILEVNSAQPCVVYARESNLAQHSHKMLPLPGSEGYIDKKYGGVYARGGDLFTIGDTIYVVIANYNGINQVYSFDSHWLIEQSTLQESSQPSSQPSSEPSPQPSAQLSSEPSSQPSLEPSASPAETPSSQPSAMPSRQPSS